MKSYAGHCRRAKPRCPGVSAKNCSGRQALCHVLRPSRKQGIFPPKFAYASQVARAVCTALGPLGDADDLAEAILGLLKTKRAWCVHQSAEIGRKRLFSGQAQPTLSAGHRTARAQLISTITCALVPLMLCVSPNRSFRAPWCRPGILASCWEFYGAMRAGRRAHHEAPKCACNSMALPLQIRPRDFCWASEGDVVPLTEYLDELRVSHTARYKLQRSRKKGLQAFGCVQRGACPELCHITFAGPAHLGY